PTKRMRKPLVQGSVKKLEAVTIWLVFLLVGLLLSLIQNLTLFGILCILIITNALYSIPILTPSKSKSGQHDDDQETRMLDITRPRSLKYTIVGLPLVFIMQFLKILLPWTLTTELAMFPFLFASGFSLLYLVLFKGYKTNYTIGESIMHKPRSFGAAVIVFVLSMLIHQEPMLQASIFLYLVAGIALFRNSRLIDKKVIFLGSVYILLGIVFLFWLIPFFQA
ncbi:MAG: hypothetical protein ACW96N_03805, partial [Candidatus Thorarchaeota archaeon]